LIFFTVFLAVRVRGFRWSGARLVVLARLNRFQKAQEKWPVAYRRKTLGVDLPGGF
jgi:hypothetical protein